jgi:hypothetical protein
MPEWYVIPASLPQIISLGGWLGDMLMQIC